MRPFLLLTATLLCLIRAAEAQTTVQSFSPASGTLGTTVTITGTQFYPSTDSNAVYFGATRATVTSATTTSLQVKVPQGIQYRPITVINLSTGLSATSAAYFDPAYAIGAGANTVITATPVVGATFQTNTAPTQVITGDIDGDGRPDIVALTNGNVSVQLNHAEPGLFNSTSFAPNYNIGIGSGPTWFTLADMDGDGKLDIVGSSVGPSNAGVFLVKNTSTPGHLSFAAVEYIFVTGPVAIADMDGDGKPDVVAAYYGYLTLSKNTTPKGAAAFTFQDFVQIPMTAGNPTALSVADFDMDGKPDVLIAGQGSYLGFFKNKATPGVIDTGTVAAMQTIPLGSIPYAMVAGDVDLDGKPDIVISDTTGVAVIRNLSSAGTLSLGTPTELPIGKGTVNLDLTDIDGDGKPDIGAVNIAGTMSLLKNTGGISFAPQTEVWPPSPFTSTTMMVTDIDGDGKPELIDAQLGQYGNYPATDIYAIGLNTHAPVLTSFQADSAGTGTTVTLKGQYFTGAGAIQFGDSSSASFLILSDTAATAAIGGGATGNVSLTTPLGTASLPGFSYVPSPVISGFTPARAGRGDTVTITGKYLSHPDTLLLGGFAATAYTVVSDSVIKAVVGNYGDPTGTVRLVTAFGVDSAAGFHYIPYPLITSFSPLVAQPGDTITIMGQYFNVPVQYDTVFFGSAMASHFTVVSDSEIKAVVGSGSTGSVNVRTLYGSNSLAGFQFVQSAPTIQSVSPLSGPVGTVITIQGTNFNPIASQNIIYFGGAKALARTATSTTLTVAVPAGAMYRPISVTTGLTTAISNLMFDVTFAGGSISKASFAPAQDFSFAPTNGPNAVVIGDLDGDGLLDVAEALGSTVYVGRNTSSGSTVSFGTPSIPPSPGRTLALVDMNGDGKLDLAASPILIQQGGTVNANFSKPGSLSFGPAVTFVSQSLGDFAYAYNDVDGDGRIDIAASSSYNNDVIIGRNTTLTDSLGFTDVAHYGGGNFPTGLIFTDLDGDGRPDLAIVSSQGETISLVRNTTTGGTVAGVLTTLSGGIEPWEIAAPDLDGDGKPDLIVANGFDSTLLVFLNTSTPGNFSFAAPIKLQLGTSKNGMGFDIADLDGDGKPDIVSPNTADSSLSIFRNTSTVGSLSFADSVQFPVESATSFVVLADINGDGRMDMVTYGSNRSNFAVYLNQPGATQPTITAFTPDTAAQGDTLVITGHHFTGLTNVQIGSTPATYYLAVNDSTIKTVVGTGGTGSVSVTTPQGAASLAGFVYRTPAPVITLFTPTSAAAGATITLTGTNLDAVTGVTVGGVPVTSFNAASSTSLVATLGTGASGAVTITSPLGADSLKGFNFIYPAPQIAGFGPLSAGPHQQIQIHGTHFTGTTSVTINGAPVESFMVSGDDTIWATIAWNQTSGNIGVVTPYGSTVIGAFTFVTPGPSITSASPDTAIVGKWLTINGTYLDSTKSVEVNGVYADAFKIISDTQIQALVDPATLTGRSLLQVFCTYGTGANFYLQAETDPAHIVSVSPDTAQTGQTIAIYGKNLSNVTAVRIGNQPVTSFTIYSDTLIYATVAVESWGKVFIQSSVLDSFKFTYVPPVPVINSFSPAQGQERDRIYLSGGYYTGTTGATIGGMPVDSFYVADDYDMYIWVGRDTSGPIGVTTASGTGYSTTSFRYLQPYPVINSFTPTSATEGNVVTIRGYHFSNVTKVSFENGYSTQFTIVSDSVITAVVPSTASSGDVILWSANGNNLLAGFTYITPYIPAITGVSPLKDTAGGIVTITGSNFTGATSVTFGGTPAASFTVVNANQITAIVGPGSSGYVTVANANFADSVSGFVWATTLISPITITSITPSYDTIGGVITIMGTGFLRNTTNVYFNGVPAVNVAVLNGTHLTAKINGGTPVDQGMVVVSNANGSDTSYSFEVIAFYPTITSFSPTSGTAGTTVNITGQQLGGATSVLIGGVPATSFTIVSPTLITAVAGNGSSGDIIVLNSLGDGDTTGIFTFTGTPPQPPVISTYSPASATTGSTVTLTGTNFNGATSVSFGGVPATSFNVVSAGTITAVVGPGATGSIVVTTPVGSDTVGGFTYTTPPPPAPPVIASFSPTSAKTDSAVTITGNNFTGATAVSFGNTPAASFTVVSPTSITAVIASGATGNVVVTTPAGSDTVGGFTYIAPPPPPAAPVISSFIPTTATTGATVTITGSNLTGVYNVTFGNTPATSFTVVSPTTITALVGSGSTGGVIVTSPGGSDTLGGFTYTTPPPAPPVIASFSPTSAKTDSTVIITGSNFTGATAVSFGNTPAASFTVVSPTSITAVIGSGATGNVVVTTPSGSDTASGFTYIAPPPPPAAPVISSFTPTSDTTGGTVTITGSNFTGTTAVSFGGTPAASFTVISPTSITAVIGSGTTGNVVVTTPSGSDTASGFTYIAPPPPPAGPVISSFTPTTATTGATVTITGSNFTGVYNVTFGNTPATSFTVVSPTTITALVGSGSTGGVIVTSPGGSDTLGGFTYTTPPPAPPVIASFLPTSATTDSTVTITGNNFTGATAVSFGGTPAALFTVISPTSITAVIASGTTGNVVVTTPAGSDTVGGFTYIAPPPPPAAPVISSFTPTSDTTGGTVTITGSNFTGATAVSFGGTPAASFTVSSSTSIIATVGSGATGNVIVTTPSGSDTASGFTYIAPPPPPPAPPVISSFTPTSAPTDTTVVITGSNFTGATAVSFGGTPAASFSVSGSTVIYATVGAGATGNIIVTTPAGSDTVSGFTYIVALPALPVISSFTPTSDTTGGTVTITGSNFTGATAVSFGNTPVASFTVVSPTTITAVIAGGSTGKVAVTTPAGTDTVSGFTYITPPPPPPAAPVITMFSPTSAKTDSTVIITGSNFTGATAVSFGGTPAASFTVSSSTTIIATIGSGTTGNVIVTTPAGSDTAGGFTYIAPPALPVISSFTPTSDTTGGTVTITGSNFTGATAVSFGNTPAASYIVVSSTTITAVIAGGSTGKVAVTTPSGTDTVTGFTYIAPPPPPPAPPVISSFTPTSAPTDTNVVITGSNFTGATAVSFGGTPAASFSVSGSTLIYATVGAGATGNIIVTTPAGSDTISGFTYIAPVSRPVISSFTPTSDTTGGTVTITGSNFTGATAVSFGGTSAASFTVVSPTTITAVIAGGSTGKVAVTTPAGTDTVSGFTYITPPPPPPATPVITMFSPTSAKTDSTVIITGSNFTGATAVSFGGTPAASFTVSSSTTIIATVGSGATGNVIVTTPSGSDTVSGFTYIAPPPPPTGPVISSFTPTTATTGATVTITGSNFTGATAVSFGGTPAASFTVVSPTSITAVIGSGATGNVIVTTPSGSDTVTGFTYIVPPPAGPIISSFTPTSDTTGGTVTITGSNFTGATAVSFGGTSAASFTVVNSTTITAIIGSGATGDVIVTTSAGGDAASGFTYTLPFAVTSFTGSVNGSDVSLAWKTQYEGAVDQYTVSRSVDSVAFNVINTTSALHGSGATTNNYACTDDTPSVARNVYRLTALDSAGHELMHKDIVVQVGNPVQVTAYPNPASGVVNLQVPNSPHTATLQLVNLNGTLVRQVSVPSGVTQVQMDLTGVASGIYILTWQDGTNRTEKNIMVQ